MTQHHSAAAICSRLLALGPAILLALMAAGCDEPATISKYETPRVEPRAKPVDANEVRALLDHMFAAVVPAGDQAWFFKVVVPAPAADAVRKPFDDFLATVNAAPGAKLPAWSLPKGWTEEPGSEMRAATIFIPHGDEKFELTVSSLPRGEDWTAYLKLNVNRWMGQLQQDGLDDATIDTIARKRPTQGVQATAFELVGSMQRNAMGMAGGMPPGHPPLGASESAPPAAADGAAPVAGAASPAPAAGGLTYKAPTGWQQGPLSVMGMRREASFVIPTDVGKAELSVTKFAATGQMAQLEPNVQRWAGQVGVTNLTPDDVRNSAKRAEVDGESALRFEFSSPPDVPEPQSIIAVMAVRGEEVWFVKLWGAKPAVESQREAFSEFLASTRFPGDE